MSPIDPLQARTFDLPCSECGKISHKSFLELETKDRLSCDHCGISIKVADYYGNAELEAFLKSIGRSGYILRQRNKRN